MFRPGVGSSYVTSITSANSKVETVSTSPSPQGAACDWIL
jgi:hypothetical protein